MPASDKANTASGAVKPLQTQSPLQFIPHFYDVMSLLEGKDGLTGIVNLISKDRGIRPPVDPKTLRKLTSSAWQSVRPSSLQRLEQFFRDAVPDLVSTDEQAQMLAPWATLGQISNGPSWFVSVLVPLERRARERLAMRSVRFLRMRINQEYQLLANLRDQGGGLQKGGSALIAIWSRFLREQTLMTDRQFEQSFGAFRNEKHHVTPGHDVAVAAQRLNLYLKVDFFYSLMACFEYDLRPAMQVDNVGDRELFGEMVPAHDEGEYREPVEVVLDGWRQDFAEVPSKSLTWMEMAGNLRNSFNLEPEKRPEFSGNADDARQFMREVKKARLHDWRKGNKRPQKEQMDAFVRSLVPADQVDWWACLRLYWANALGKLIEAEKKNNEKFGGLLEEIEITRAFCCYERYQRRFGEDCVEEKWDAETGPADQPAPET